MKFHRLTAALAAMLLTGGLQTRTADPADLPLPPPGHASFYLVQYHDERGPTGFGSVSAPWPLEVVLPDP